MPQLTRQQCDMLNRAVKQSTRYDGTAPIFPAGRKKSLEDSFIIQEMPDGEKYNEFWYTHDDNGCMTTGVIHEMFIEENL